MRVWAAQGSLGFLLLACSGGGGGQSSISDAAPGPQSSGGTGMGGVSSGGGAGGTGGTASGGGGAAGASGMGGRVSGAGGFGSGGIADTSGDAGACHTSCGTHRWACWPMPNPAGSGLPNAASYTDLGDGTVRDDVTCLTWQKEVPAASYTVTDGKAYCQSVGPGFRLATRIELMSIMDFTATGAKIDGVTFPGTPRAFFKTGSEWVLTTKQIGAGQGKDLAWAFNFSDGITSNARSGATPDRIRCVKGGGDAELDAAAGAIAVPPPNQYTVVAVGEVGDNYTGLIWQSEFSTTQMNWADARTYCTTLGLNGHAWRLPSIRELSTLVDEAQVAPAINRTMFPGTKYGSRSNNWYWASHRAQGSATAAWAINFDDGFTGANGTTDTTGWNYFTDVWVRCVR